MMIRPELLAPAGNLEKLRYAFAYGADAVYLGGREFSLRAAAGNFEIPQIKEAVEIAKGFNKKVYLTVNIVAYNQDLDIFIDYLKELKSINIDALIVSDPGIFLLLKKYLPEIKIHISVQANVTNYLTASFWKERGAKRITLARELSLNDIKIISQNVDIETEIFVHGAMCIAYSGRCLLSKYFSERDANRGDCAQCCRWKYYLLEEKRPGVFCAVEETREGTYLFNSKDLCLAEKIPLLISTGINSFKIEGRMKSLHYLATVLWVYRQIIDESLKVEDIGKVNNDYVVELEKINRRGYTEGFLEQKRDHENIEKAALERSVDFIGVIDNLRLDEVFVRNRFKVGDRLECIWPNGGKENFKVEKIWEVENNNQIDEAHPNMKVDINHKAFHKWAILRKIN